MEQFYLNNVDRYRTLVQSFNNSNPNPDPTNAAQDASKQDQQHVVVAARVRPMLDEDRAAGFPSAIFPRKTPDGEIGNVADIHDLYNHPRGKPILKV